MSDDPRLTDLEIRLTHQEKTIEELNKTVYEQWQVIESMNKTLSLLKEKMKEVTPSNIDDAPYQPPHY